MLSSACRYTLPPSPPSPPSGPPKGINFKRKKLQAPLPPFPASTEITASSTNFMVLSLFKLCPKKHKRSKVTKKPRNVRGSFSGHFQFKNIFIFFMLLLRQLVPLAQC